MLCAFTYAVLWRDKDALPRLLELLPESVRGEVRRVADEAAGLTRVELAARIAELRGRDLAEAEARVGSLQNCPANILEWKYRRLIR